MIQEVLQYLNNYFVVDTVDSSLIETDGITVLENKFVVGQYILVLYSKLNDGVYKISGITGNKLSIDTDLDLLEESGAFYVCGLAIPRAVLTICGEIDTYNTNHSSMARSESLGDYSVTWGNDDVSWISSFRKRLAPYRKVYLNLPKKDDYDCWNR